MIVTAGGKQQLKLTDDFAVTGSGLYLVLANGDLPAKGALWLGKLQHAAGAQTYDLPKGKDLSAFTKLLVWSKGEASGGDRRLASGWRREDATHVTGGAGEGIVWAIASRRRRADLPDPS